MHGKGRPGRPPFFYIMQKGFDLNMCKLYNVHDVHQPWADEKK